MTTVGVDLHNTGDSTIRARVQIPAANFDKYLSAFSVEWISFKAGQTYNIKLTQGRTVKNIEYV